MRSHSIRLAVAASAALAGATAGAAQPVDLSTLAPAQQAHFAQVQSQRRPIQPDYNYDIKPPVLTHVHAGGKVDASKKGAQTVVSVAAKDNLTGVDQVSVTVQSPSGQQAWTTWSSPFARQHNQLDIGVDMSAASENGEWRLVGVSVRDANGNTSNYDEAALASLGSTTFMVVKAAGDLLSPSLAAGGVNLTPTVSRSTPPRGQLPGSPTRVGVQLAVQDEGVAGVANVHVEYCLDGGWDCFYMEGGNSVHGRNHLKLTAGTHVWSYQSLGTYLPYQITVSDFSGNTRSYYAWDTDFSLFIDAPSIEIVE